MSIRYRLLFIVGFMTSLVFLLNFEIENRLALRHIREVKAQVADFQMQTYERKNRETEAFIRDALAKKLAQINSLLKTISMFPPLAEWFSASEEHIKGGTWNHAAALLQSEDWVQFLQNTAGSKLLSLVIPDGGPFFDVKSTPIEEGLAWVSIVGSAAYLKPCLGIEIPVRFHEENAGEPSSLLSGGVIPKIYALYSLDRFRSLEFPLDSFSSMHEEGIPIPFIQDYELDEEKFFSCFQRAIELAKEPSFKEPESLEAKTFDLSLRAQTADFKNASFQQVSQDYLARIMEYSSELFLLWGATALPQFKLFGQGAQGAHWPDAFSFSVGTQGKGKVVFSDSTLGFTSPIFGDQAFFKANPPPPGSSISSGGGIVKSPYPNQAFFVNTAEICSPSNPGQKSLLTIGFDLNNFLYDLAMTSRRYACMTNGKEALTYVVPEHLPDISFEALVPALLQTTAPWGAITVGNEEYIFSKVQADPSMDLFFFFFLPKKIEIAIFLAAQDGISVILHHLWIQRLTLEIISLIALWFLLLNLAKKITRPLIALASSLHHVKNGEWDLIKLPSLRYHKKNEIQVLMDSFHDMIEGLKEKEKMSGVLNKVVSKEIAQEILKGEVHLGGEEKVVTMLFADIRGFTKLTQNMPPHEVIELLNTCMTKLSKAIEENKGVIDKYLGDGIMALYGAPVSYPESPLYAVISGLEMIEMIRVWDQDRVKKGLPPLDIGIGIHTGAVCAGNMGALHRLNYTVIGSHVNMASRLCYAAGPGELLISADTYLDPSVGKNIEVEDKGLMTFKGFDEKKQVYKVVGLKDKNFGKVLILEGEQK